MTFPRILIVNVEPLHGSSATGLTALSLLKDWPKDKLAQIYTHPIPPDVQFCERTVRVGCQLDRPPFVLFLPRAQARPGDAARITERASGRIRQLCSLGQGRLRQDLLDWIEAFAPDAIYTMLYDLDIMTMIVEIARSFGIPVIPHFMDDWPLTLSSRSILYRALDRWWKNRLDQVMEVAPTALTISEAMAAEFARRYGRPMRPFMFCVERDQFSSTSPPRPSSVTKFAYVGGLHLNRWRVLREIGLVMQELGEEGLQIEATVYTHPRTPLAYRRNLTLPPVMKVAGSLDHEDVAAAQRNADWLIHVESFEEWDRRFTKLSISSKLPEYLAAARPVFAYGPGEVASMQYLIDLDCAVTVTEQNRDILKSALRRAATTPELGRQLGNAALSAARTRHDGPNERARFQQVIACAVTDWKKGQRVARTEVTHSVPDDVTSPLSN